VRIDVDFDICESNAVCMQFAPTVFEVGDDDLLSVLTPDVAPEDEAAVAEAVRRCPRQAIRFVD
jgi:ferredoxin